MTEPLTPSHESHQTERPQDGGEKYVIGYGRPPKQSQFRPGQSGNPQGRPKGSRNLKTKLKELYTGKVVMHDGGKKRLVTRLEALLTKQWERGIKGSERATEAAIENAESLGVFDEVETDKGSQGLDLSREMIATLTNEELALLIKLEKRRLKKH